LTTAKRISKAAEENHLLPDCGGGGGGGHGSGDSGYSRTVAGVMQGTAQRLLQDITLKVTLVLGLGRAQPQPCKEIAISKLSKIKNLRHVLKIISRKC
jgi:hypothetical protein